MASRLVSLKREWGNMYELEEEKKQIGTLSKGWAIYVSHYYNWLESLK